MNKNIAAIIGVVGGFLMGGLAVVAFLDYVTHPAGPNQAAATTTSGVVDIYQLLAGQHPSFGLANVASGG